MYIFCIHVAAWYNANYVGKSSYEANVTFFSIYACTCMNDLSLDDVKCIGLQVNNTCYYYLLNYT